MPSINVQPAALDLALYAGDGVSFRLICTDNANDPVDVSGAMAAQVRVDRITDVAPIVEFNADLADAADGIVSLSLTGVDTQALVDHPSSKDGVFSGVWDVEWIPTGKEPRTLCQGKVECVADVTR
jgi:hypothetical protein